MGHCWCDAGCNQQVALNLHVCCPVQHEEGSDHHHQPPAARRRALQDLQRPPEPLEPPGTAQPYRTYGTSSSAQVLTGCRCDSQYGYRLPELEEGEAVYCSVYFRPLGEKVFTYPLNTDLCVLEAAQRNTA